jgi:hypothetical protein
MQLRAHFNYAARVQLNPGAGTVATNVFSANGLYDPDITGAGHQPMGWDELIELYDHGVVKHARIEVQLQPQPTCVYGVSVVGSTTVPYTDPLGFIESAHTSWQMADHYYSTAGGLRAITLTQSVDIAKFLGVKDLMDGREFASDNGSNPSEGVFFMVWAAASDGSTDPISTNFIVKITYESMMVEPRHLAQS